MGEKIDMGGDVRGHLTVVSLLNLNLVLYQYVTVNGSWWDDNDAKILIVLGLK